MKELLEDLKIDRTGPIATSPTRRRGPRTWTRRALFAAATVALAGVAASAYFAGSRPLLVEVFTVTAPPGAAGAAPLLTAGGYVRDAKVVYVAPKVAGRIVSLSVREGDEVRAGDAIAAIDTRDLEQEAAEARANYALALATLRKLQAGSRAEEIAAGRAKVEAAVLAQQRSERELERARTLLQYGIVTAQAFDQIETEARVGARTVEAARQSLLIVEAGPRKEEIETAQAAVSAARARMVTAANRLEYTRIQAPVAGRVLKKFRNVGDFVSPDVPFIENYETVAVGSPVVSLATLGEQEVSADINETDIAKIILGQHVELSPNAYPGETFHGTVTEISPRADRNKNTVEVKVTIDRPARVLPYDLSVKLRFLGQPAASAPPRIIQIPADAIITKGDKHFVFVASGPRASLRQVKLGRTEAGQTAVTAGLSNGDRVIVGRLDALEDGTPIRVR